MDHGKRSEVLFAYLVRAQEQANDDLMWSCDGDKALCAKLMRAIKAIQPKMTFASIEKASIDLDADYQKYPMSR